MKKVVITGGHLTPAMAVIQELKKEGGWQIFYLGRAYSMEGVKIPSEESQVIPSLGVSFIPLVSGRLQRRLTRFTLPSLLKIPFGFGQSLFLLLKIRPNLVVSFGGYVSVPVVVAGWLLGIPVFTHEQTIVFGLASKINSFFAKRIAVSFKDSLKYFPKKKVVLTGNPIRQEIFGAKKPPDPQLEEVMKKTGLPLIYITGGSQGAQVINLAVLEVLTEILTRYILIHQTGARDYQKILARQDQLSEELRKRYFVRQFIGPEIGWVFRKAALVVSRAGANTVCELAFWGKPAILIPIPWVYKNEQRKNALILKKVGLAEILSQDKLSGRSLLRLADKVYQNLENYKKKAKAAQTLIVHDANSKIIKEIKKLAS